MKNINKIKYGDNFKLGEYNVIAKNVKFGNNVTVGNFCEIHEDCIIGNNVMIQGRVRMAKGCIIEDNVTIKYGVILTSKVLVKQGAFIGPNTITFGAEFKKGDVVVEHGTVIGERCIIGGGTHIKANTKICNDVVTGSHTYVNKDITVPAIYVGQPMHHIYGSDPGHNCPMCGDLLLLDKTQTCPVSVFCTKCERKTTKLRDQGMHFVQCTECNKLFVVKDDPDKKSVFCGRCGSTTPYDYPDDTDEEEIKIMLRG